MKRRSSNSRTAVGFRYAYDSASKQFAHAERDHGADAGREDLRAIFTAFNYPSRDLRLGLVEASEGKIGTPVDQVLLFCYHYDPSTGKYGLLISHVIQIGGAAHRAGAGHLMLVLVLAREHYALPQKSVTGHARGNSWSAA